MINIVKNKIEKELQSPESPSAQYSKCDLWKTLKDIEEEIEKRDLLEHIHKEDGKPIMKKGVENEFHISIIESIALGFRIYVD